MAESRSSRNWRRPAGWLLLFLGVVLLLKGVDANLWAIKEVDRQHFGVLRDLNSNTPRADTAESNRASFAASLRGVVLCTSGAALIGIALSIWRPWRKKTA